MTCRRAVLDAFDRLKIRTGHAWFDSGEVMAGVQSATKRYLPSTIRRVVLYDVCGIGTGGQVARVTSGSWTSALADLTDGMHLED